MEDIRSMELSFFGKMTAGFTHEVKNVLAIIKENAGLMEDILLMMRGEPLPKVERLARAIASIQEQADRGVELSNSLNRFAHSADHPRAHVDLNLLIEQLGLLAQRFARLREIELEATPCDGVVQVDTNPVGLQIALFKGLECCWNAMPPGGSVSLQVMSAGSVAAIAFSCRCSPEPGPELVKAIELSQDWANLNRYVNSLGGRIQTGFAGHHFAVILSVNGQETP